MYKAKGPYFQKNDPVMLSKLKFIIELLKQSIDISLKYIRIILELWLKPFGEMWYCMTDGDPCRIRVYIVWFYRSFSLIVKIDIV